MNNAERCFFAMGAYFIENAFKHGVGNVLNPFISIEFMINEGLLNFKVVNKIGKVFSKTLKIPIQ